MASLLAIGGTALVNALAFSGTNAAFSMLGSRQSRGKATQPSRQRKDAEIVLAVAGMSIAGVLAYTMK